MKLLKLTCGNCGAPIDSAIGRSRHVVCPYCHAQLRIHHCEGAIYTAIAVAIDRSAGQISASTPHLNTSTTEIESSLSVLRAENAVMELDQQWQQTLDSISTRTASGTRYLPNPAAAVGLGVLALFVLPIVFFLIDDWRRVCVIPFIPLLLWLSWKSWIRSQRFSAATASYIRQRQHLMDELAQVRNQVATVGPPLALHDSMNAPRSLTGADDARGARPGTEGDHAQTKLVPVICQRCAAPLRVPDNVEFVTCAHCDARLQIDFEGDRFRSRVLDDLKRYAKRVQQHAHQITDAANQLQRESTRLRLRNDLLRIDGDLRRLQDWFARERARFVKAGKRSTPHVGVAALQGGLQLTFVLLPISFFAYQSVIGSERRGLTMFVSAVLGLVALFILLRTILRIRTAKRYRSLVSEYQYHQRILNRRFADIQSQLNALDRGK